MAGQPNELNMSGKLGVLQPRAGVTGKSSLYGHLPGASRSFNDGGVTATGNGGGIGAAPRAIPARFSSQFAVWFAILDLG